VISDSAALGGGANPSKLNLNLHVGAKIGSSLRAALERVVPPIIWKLTSRGLLVSTA